MPFQSNRTNLHPISRQPLSEKNLPHITARYGRHQCVIHTCFPLSLLSSYATSGALTLRKQQKPPPKDGFLSFL